MTYIQNWPLMWRVLRHVLDHPDEYDQTRWWSCTPCGTTRCIAGWITAMSGYREPDPDKDDAALIEHFKARGHWAVPVGFTVDEIDHLVIDKESGAVAHVRAAALAAIGASDSFAVTEMFLGSAPFGRILNTAARLARADGVEVPDWMPAAQLAHPFYSDDEDDYDEEDD